MLIVHAADLHLDSPLRGLSARDGEEARIERVRGATRRAFGRLIDACVERRADVLLLVGDVFDGEWRDFATGLFFVRELSRLRDSGTRVVFLRGNHDAASRVTRVLTWPDHVVELSTRRPETHVFEDIGVAVHGQGYATRAVTDDLTRAYPAPIDGAFNVGMLHTALGGRPGHEPYAPTSAQRLATLGYAYWALGHVHAREVVLTDPLVVFPGNLQGRHIGEEGEKGATFVDVSESHEVNPVHHAFDDVRWTQLAVDARRASAPADVLDLMRAELVTALASAPGRLLCARVTVACDQQLSHRLVGDWARLDAEVRAAALDAVGHARADHGLDEQTDAWIEKIAIKAAKESVAAGAAGELTEELMARVAGAFADMGTGDDLRAELEPLLAKLPVEIDAELPGARALSPELVNQLTDEAQALVWSMLIDKQERP